jgi:hypothetical protein
MGKRQTTIVCIFDPKSPRITAFQIHEWIHEKLKLLEDEVRMIQIDGPWRRVYIKLNSEVRLQAVLHATQGQLDYIHENGELSVVYIERAGMGVPRVRVANLPPEVQDRKLHEVIPRYGEVRAITEEQRSRGYRYPVHNGIRVVEMDLKNHIPSHMTIVGTRALISYEGQPIMCYGCNEPGHQYLECPSRKTTRPPPISTDNTNSWANIVEQGTPKIQFEKRRKETGTAMEDMVQMNSREEDRQEDEELTPRGREEMTPPRELWTSLITEETAHELEVGTQQEDTRMDTENIADTVEGKG